MTKQDRYDLNKILKRVKKLLNDWVDEGYIADCIMGLFLDDEEVLTLHQMPKAEINTFIRTELLKSIPKTFPSLLDGLKRAAEDITDMQSIESESNDENKKKLIASMTKEQKALYNEIHKESGK